MYPGRTRRLAALALAATGLALIPLAPAAARSPQVVAHTVEASSAAWLPVINQDFPDPSVIDVNGTYAAYSTEVLFDAVPYLETQDLSEWNNNLGDALPPAGMPPWADQNQLSTWSPSVAQNAAGQFVMYYSTVDGQLSPETHCIGRAVLSPSAGSFVDGTTEPVLCQPTLGGSIDPDVFHDPTTGQNYLAWKSDGASIGQPNELWAEPLDANLEPVAGMQPSPLLSPDAAWQNGNIEGPSMIESHGTYLLFYSGNQYTSADYGIGVAICTTPLGPCTDTTGPVLTSTNGFEGPGGASFFTAQNGQLMMAFSAWDGTGVGYQTRGNYRAMFLASVDLAVTASEIDLTFDPLEPTTPTSPVSVPTQGYWEVGADGGIFSYGNAPFYGSTGAFSLNAPVVSMATTEDGAGYWFVTALGRVFNYGDAPYYGSADAYTLDQPIVGMTATPDDGGYWLVARDGGIFAFGDAGFFGSMGGQPLNEPIVGMAADPVTGGYWEVAADGGIFAFDAPFLGSTGNIRLNRPVVGMAATGDGQGYWFVASDGGMFSEGDAPFYGSMGGQPLNEPVVGMAPTHDDGGYRLVAADGGIFSFGDASFYGSMGGRYLAAPVVTIGTAH